MHFHHINHVWAYLIIDSLKQAGVNHICIAPGSRSTPLTLAAAKENIECHLHFDERALGFMALGLAKRSKHLVAIITTSGTAVANLYPAVIEASLTQVPLLVLSADRPPELINCGANQAIEQQGIFADYPCFQVNLGVPSRDRSAVWLIEQVQQAIDHSLYGPVHLNCMFAEPLYPDDKLSDYSDYLAELSEITVEQNENEAVRQTQADERDFWQQQRQQKGIVIVGQMSSAAEAQQLAEFASQMNWPLLPDLQSQLAGHAEAIQHYDLLLKRADFTDKLNEAKVIVQFGARLISKRLGQFIKQFQGVYWQIDPAPIKLDPLNKARRFYQGAQQWLEIHPTAAIDERWLQGLQVDEAMLSELLNRYLSANSLTELAVAHRLPRLLPEHSVLFVGNSMPARLFDMLGQAYPAGIEVYTNRGASGIDGLLATAVGIAKVSTEAVTLVIGDISLLHDLNSLYLASQADNLVIILLNNDGGSIFNMLPVPNEVRQEFYQLPHNSHFAASCEQFDLRYLQARDWPDFVRCYQSAQQAQAAVLIEVTVPNQESAQLLNELGEAIAAHAF